MVGLTAALLWRADCAFDIIAASRRRPMEANMKKTSEKTRQYNSITVTNLGDRVRVTGGAIPPIVGCSVLFDAFVEVSKTSGMSRKGLADQLRAYARQIEAMGDDEYNSSIRSLFNNRTRTEF
jgi:hypothetical protein